MCDGRDEERARGAVFQHEFAICSGHSPDDGAVAHSASFNHDLSERGERKCTHKSPPLSLSVPYLELAQLKHFAEL